MDGWLNYEDFQRLCPGSSLTEAQFPQAAADAALLIHTQTHWRSALDQTDDARELLAQCQARLIQLSTEVGSGSWDGVTSVNNHGYTESYASGQDQQQYIRQQQNQIIDRVLSAPATRWLLYNGGVYHPPRRH